MPVRLRDMRIALFATWPNGQKVSISNIQGKTIGHSHYCPILKRQVFRVTDANKKDVFTTIFGRSRSLNPSLPMFMLELDTVDSKGQRELQTLDLDKELNTLIIQHYKDNDPIEFNKTEPIVEDSHNLSKAETIRDIVAIVKDFPGVPASSLAKNLNSDVAFILDCVKESPELTAKGKGVSSKIFIK